MILPCILDGHLAQSFAGVPHDQYPPACVQMKGMIKERHGDKTGQLHEED